MAPAIAVALIAAETALGCDGCKAALNSAANIPRFGEGMGYSIYFMLSMPFLLLGAFAALIWWKIRQARLKSNRP